MLLVVGKELLAHKAPQYGSLIFYCRRFEASRKQMVLMK
jgi:hypothetical protein